MKGLDVGVREFRIQGLIGFRKFSAQGLGLRASGVQGFLGFTGFRVFG